MNIAQALELAEKSMEAFEEKMKDIELKEHYELADNLRFVNKMLPFSKRFTKFLGKDSLNCTST